MSAGCILSVHNELLLAFCTAWPVWGERTDNGSMFPVHVDVFMLEAQAWRLSSVSFACVQVLSLLGCSKVSDEAIAAVALHGTLQSLNVNSIPGIGLSTIKALATATRYACTVTPPAEVCAGFAQQSLIGAIAFAAGYSCHGGVDIVDMLKSNLFGRAALALHILSLRRHCFQLLS